jgi:hypothetical protein
LEGFHKIICREFEAYLSQNRASLHGFNPENEFTNVINVAIRAAQKELGLGMR